MSAYGTDSKLHTVRVASTYHSSIQVTCFTACENDLCKTFERTACGASVRRRDDLRERAGGARTPSEITVLYNIAHDYLQWTNLITYDTTAFFGFFLNCFD